MIESLNTFKNCFLFICILLAFSGGCTTGSRNDLNDGVSGIESEEKKLDNQLFGNMNPENHIDDVRQYVFSSDIQLSEKETLLIQNTKPKIVKNANKLEYCFFWVMTDGTIIEVITMPPPSYDLITVNRSREIRFI